MHKLSELKGVNERCTGSVLFSFDLKIDGVPAEDEERLYADLQKLVGQQLAALEPLLPHGVSLAESELQMEDIDVTVEDDYDRLGSINCNL